MNNRALATYQQWLDAKQKKGMTVKKFAQEIGETHAAVRNLLQRGKIWNEFRHLSAVDIDEAWRLKGDWIIVGDVHLPFVDWGFAGLVSEVADRHGITNLLIGGDFMDMANFSYYAQVIEPPTWAQERDAARGLLTLWRKQFKQVRWILGNHERRLQKFAAGAFDEDDLAALIISNPDWLRMSVRSHCIIDTPYGEWRVTHPKNYSINRLTTADTLAQKYQQHIISFHEHHLAKAWDRYGNYCIVNGGCLCDPTKMAYVALDDSKHAVYALGFVMLKGGVAHLYGEAPFTDWSGAV